MKDLLKTTAFVLALTGTSHALTISNTATVHIQSALIFEGIEDLQFGNVVPPATGSATLNVYPNNPVTGNLIHTGIQLPANGTLFGDTGLSVQATFSADNSVPGINLGTFNLMYNGVNHVPVAGIISGLVANQAGVSVQYGARLTVDSTVVGGDYQLAYNVEYNYE